MLRRPAFLSSIIEHLFYSVKCYFCYFYTLVDALFLDALCNLSNVGA